MNNNGSNRNKLFDEVVASSGGRIDRLSLENAMKNKNAEKLINNLSREDKEKLNSILSDKASMEKILSDPKVKAMLKAFGGGKNG